MADSPTGRVARCLVVTVVMEKPVTMSPAHAPMDVVKEHMAMNAKCVSDESLNQCHFKHCTSNCYLQNQAEQFDQFFFVACKTGFYGKDCSNNCSENCFETTSCDRFTGKCDKGCKSGWQGLKCKERELGTSL